MFDIAIEAPWVALREFDHFRQISEVALEAGASVDDCGILDSEGYFMAGGIIHFLIFFTLYYSKVNCTDANTFKLQAFIAYFVKIGLSIEDKNGWGKTPFLYAAECHYSLSITFLRILLEQGANLTARDDMGRSALHLVIEKFRIDTWINDTAEADSLGSTDDDPFDDNSSDDESYDDNSSDDDSSESEGNTDSALTSGDRDNVVLEQSPDLDFADPPESERSQLLMDKLLFLLRAGCDPGAKDNEGEAVGDYAESCGCSTTWDAALSTFNAERQGVETQDSALEERQVYEDWLVE